MSTATAAARPGPAPAAPDDGGWVQRYLAWLVAPKVSGKIPRLASVDALRALTIGLMVFIEQPAPQAYLPTQLRHPIWHGFNLADLVFPAFLFVAGVSMAFSFATRAQKGTPWWRLWLHIIVRSAILFAIGLALNMMHGGVPIRVPGVLQRIAVASVLCLPFVRLKIRWQVVAVAGFLLLHAFFLFFVTAPGITAGDLSNSGGISRYYDRALFGTDVAKHGVDPEGVLGTLSATAGMLAGVAVGSALLRRKVRGRTVLLIAAVGVVVALAALALSWTILPLNKRLWTPSFAMFNIGVDIVLLMALYELTDRLGWSWLFKPIEPLGRNPLVAYVGAALLAYVLINIPAPDEGSYWWALGAWFIARWGEVGGTVMFSLAYVAFWDGLLAITDYAGIRLRL